jgi:GT2 family glycosyltransferase
MHFNISLSALWPLLFVRRPFVAVHHGFYVIEQIGGFEKSFDFLHADIDFSLRLQDADWSIEADSGLLCFHQGGGSPQTRSQRVVRFHQNRWRLLCGHGHVPSALLANIALWGRHLLELLVFAVLKFCPFGNREHLMRRLKDRSELLRTVCRGYQKCAKT